MSRHTARTAARICDLVEEFAIAAALRLRTDSDATRPIAQAIVMYLVEEYPSQDLYIPGGVTYPVEEIRTAVETGESIRSVCRRFRLDRRTLYRLLDKTEVA